MIQFCTESVKKKIGATFFPSPIDASRREVLENDVLRCGVVVFSVEKLSAKNGRKRATFWAKPKMVENGQHFGRNRVETGLKRGLNLDPGWEFLSIFHCGRMPAVKRTKMTNVSLEKLNISMIITFNCKVQKMYFTKITTFNNNTYNSSLFLAIWRRYNILYSFFPMRR